MKRELVDKHFQPFISHTIRSESIVLLASIPLFIKRAVLKNIYIQNMKQQTNFLSNLGAFYLPEAEGALVKDVEFISAPKNINKRDCSVISFKNTLVISFTRVCHGNEVEQFFYERLVEAGLEPQLNTYHGYDN